MTMAKITSNVICFGYNFVGYSLMHVLRGFVLIASVLFLTYHLLFLRNLSCVRDWKKGTYIVKLKLFSSIWYTNWSCLLSVHEVALGKFIYPFYPAFYPSQFNLFIFEFFQRLTAFPSIIVPIAYLHTQPRIGTRAGCTTPKVRELPLHVCSN